MQSVRQASKQASQSMEDPRTRLLHIAAVAAVAVPPAGLVALVSTELFSALDQVLLFVYIVQLESR